jgi:pimeloyl-ACP methyl ester carboxylesterase
MLHGTATSHDGTKIAFEAEGSGPPLVLLHGFAANRACWREKGYVDRVTAAGRQAILIDARGHGDSGKPHYASAYADHKRAQDVIAVLDVLKHPSADVHGFSMGGWIALAAARTYPRRVRSLSLNGAHGFAQSLETFRLALQTGMEGWIAHLEAETQMSLSERRNRQLRSNDVAALRACMAQDRRNLSPEFRELWFPSLVFCGETEPFLEQAKAFAKVLGGRFVILRGKNHASAFCASDEVCAPLLAFLQELDHGQFSSLLARGDQRHVLQPHPRKPGSRASQIIAAPQSVSGADGRPDLPRPVRMRFS